jgi:hypothetical protein
MTPRILLPLLLLCVVFPATAERRRAVRPSAPDCAFSLSHSLGATVAAAGLENGAIQVIGSPSTCTSWYAYSPADWVTVERVNNSVLVDVAPNPTTLSRTAVLLIAGIRYELIQESSSLISPPVDTSNLMKNPGFDTGLAPWGWQDRFPNGTGSAAWAPLDASNNPNSGSIRLRNTRPPDGTPAYQQLQCANVESGIVYEYGGRFLASSSTAGSAIFALVEYADEDCNVQILTKQVQSETITTPGTWQSELYTKRVGATTRSVFIVIASSAKSPGTFDVYFDDVFLRKR